MTSWEGGSATKWFSMTKPPPPCNLKSLWGALLWKIPWFKFFLKYFYKIYFTPRLPLSKLNCSLYSIINSIWRTQAPWLLARSSLAECLMTSEAWLKCQVWGKQDERKCIYRKSVREKNCGLKLNKKVLLTLEEIPPRWLCFCSQISDFKSVDIYYFGWVEKLCQLDPLDLI